MQTDPDVFVSPGPQSRPNSTHHEWAARGFGKGACVRGSGFTTAIETVLTSLSLFLCGTHAQTL